VADAQNTNWPAANFSFSVEIADVGVVVFQEVSGLDAEQQIIEYRCGTSPTLSTIKMPGIHKTGNVTLKRGIFAKDNKFSDWYKRITSNQAKRSTVTIKLLDERRNPTMTWTLVNAWPTKITSADLDATGNEVAVETLEIAHEGLTLANT
jgi:phage tail-like protein